jgi:hypothetical protein
MNGCRRPQLFIGRAQRAAGGLLRPAAARRLAAVGWLYAAALATGFTGLAACGSQPTGVEVIDGDRSDAADSITAMDGDTAPPELDMESSTDTDPSDSPDGNDALDSDVADNDAADTPMEDADAAPCENVDPCGGCADETFVPVGDPDAPCGPCAASQLVCRDGLTVCDMTECACDDGASCSEGEACIAGVCAPEGWSYVPPGEFAKGCTADYDCTPFLADRYSALSVTLTHGLLVRVTEETEESWQQVMGDRVVHPASGLGLPAVFFPIQDAMTYLNRRSEEAGLEACYELIDDETNYLDEWPLQQACDGWRLPTEAEWEYFTRAGTDTQTWAGNPEITDWFDKSRDPLLDLIAYYFGPVALLFDDPSQAYDCGNGRGDRQDVIAEFMSEIPVCRPIAVGQLRPNPWGLHDVLGNVAELVWDREGANSDYVSVVDPIRPSNTSTQAWTVSRTRAAPGGFYGDPASAIEYLNLWPYHDEHPHLQVGFQAVRSLPGVRLGRTVEPR